MCVLGGGIGTAELAFNFLAHAFWPFMKGTPLPLSNYYLSLSLSLSISPYLPLHTSSSISH